MKKISTLGLAVVLALGLQSCSSESSELNGNEATGTATLRMALQNFNNAQDRAAKMGLQQTAQRLDPVEANQQRLDEMLTDAKALLMASGYTQTNLDNNYSSTRIIELALHIYLDKSAVINQ